ncbi:MAG TPA: hypothetical protein VFB40_06970, partial [Actinocrinis sp.]
PGLGLIPLTELNVHDLVTFYRTLAKRKRSRDRAPLSAATIQRVNTTLRAALNAARRQGLIGRNPATEIGLPRGRRPKAVVWTDDQAMSSPIDEANRCTPNTSTTPSRS